MGMWTRNSSLTGKKCSFSYVTVNKYMRKVIVILHVEQSIHEKKSKDLKMRNGRNQPRSPQPMYVSLFMYCFKEVKLHMLQLNHNYKFLLSKFQIQARQILFKANVLCQTHLILWPLLPRPNGQICSPQYSSFQTLPCRRRNSAMQISQGKCTHSKIFSFHLL